MFWDATSAGNFNCWNHACLNANLQSQFWTAQYRSCQVFQWLCDHEWDLRWPLWPGNETSNNSCTVETPHFTSSVKVKDCLSQQYHGIYILGQWRNSDDWLLSKTRLVTDVPYAGSVQKLHESSKKSCCGNSTQGVLFQHDHGPAHISHAAMTTIHECGFELLSNLRYFPALALSNLFRHLKEVFHARAFENDDAVIVAVN